MPMSAMKAGFQIAECSSLSHTFGNKICVGFGLEAKTPLKIWLFHRKPLSLLRIKYEVMARLTLQVDSPSLLEQLKNVLSLMRGVKIVSVTPISRSAALEDVPNAETLAAMKEAESGHDAGVVRVDSLESFMASMEE